MKTVLCLLGLAVLLSGAGPAPEERLLEVGVVRDLPYVAGEEVGDRRKLDLYLPKGDGPWPVLLWIHGGAWAVGHRKDEEALARRFAERGIAVAAADHRMSKALWMDAKLDEGVEHPVHVKDCATAFAWLVANAGERKLDPKRMYVGGFSSGAHLTALLATDPKYLKAHGLEPSSIRGALPVGGAYDMAAYYEAHRKHNGEKMAEQHVLDVFGRKEGALLDASPTTHLGKTKVPMLVLAEKHTMDYTSLLKAAVKKAGIDWIRFRDFPDRTHGSIGKLMAREGPDEARDAMIAFILEGPVKETPPEEDPREKLLRLFGEANDLVGRGENAAALEKYDACLAVEPEMTGALYNGGICAWFLSDYEKAAGLWKRLKKLEPGDVMVRAKLVQAYQVMGRPDLRDEEREGIYQLRKTSENPEVKRLAYFCRDQFEVGEDRRKVMVFEHIELVGERGVRYVFHLLDGKGETRSRISLGSYERLNRIVREDFPGAKRRWHLDGYDPRGHATYAFYDGEPGYDEVRATVEKILTGRHKALSSSGRGAPTREGEDGR